MRLLLSLICDSDASLDSRGKCGSFMIQNCRKQTCRNEQTQTIYTCTIPYDSQDLYDIAWLLHSFFFDFSVLEKLLCSCQAGIRIHNEQLQSFKTQIITSIRSRRYENKSRNIHNSELQTSNPWN